jgi:DNA (cytosine-5)-methyltransferase 1
MLLLGSSASGVDEGRSSERERSEDPLIEQVPLKQRTNLGQGVKPVRGPFVRLPKHPFAVDDETGLAAVLKELSRPRAADLFCGAGGLSLGLSEAGFDVVLGVDHDPVALETHRSLHPGLSVDWDLGNDEMVRHIADVITQNEITLVAGGPPCQPFSRAGRSIIRDLVRRGIREHYDLRSELWQSFLLVVSMARPRAVLMENVPDMALDRDMWILRTMVDELEELGYAVEERVVATSDYGVPQSRQRLILVALENGLEFNWPEPTSETSVRGAIGDLPEVTGGWRPSNGDDPSDPVASGWMTYGRDPMTEFQKRMRRDLPAAMTDRVYDHITRPVRDDDALAFSLMDSTTKYSDLDANLRRYRSDIFDDKYKRLDWNALGRTITAHISKDGYGFIHPEQDRTITVREAARIQTFPDHVRFAGPPSAAWRQIGNAVPPRLGEVLGTAILASLESEVTRPFQTRDISAILAGWFSTRPNPSIPWLRAENRWQVIQSEILWSRMSTNQMQEAWRATRNLKTPKDTLQSMRTLERYTHLRGRDDRVEALKALAEWFGSQPSGLDPPASAQQLNEVPGLSKSISDLSIRICPGDDEERDEPVLVTHGVLRVAARVFGDDVDHRNKYTDGRLAVARLIGGQENSHDAHLALIDIANSVCTAGDAPACTSCPLSEVCSFARELNSSAD